VDEMHEFLSSNILLVASSD